MREAITLEATVNLALDEITKLIEQARSLEESATHMRRLLDRKVELEDVRRALDRKDREKWDLVSVDLLAHAVDTFGSEKNARAWLSSECGALDRQTPLQVIARDGNSKEVERILDCIDYGMFA